MSQEEDEYRPLDAKQAITRMCKLQSEVFQQMEFAASGPADCFCGEAGLWTVKGYDGSFEGGYRNDGRCIEFIEKAVREKLRRLAARKKININNLSAICEITEEGKDGK